MRKCQQQECSMLHNGECQNCEVCGTKPTIINTSCEKCMCCENVLNSLRWDVYIFKTAEAKKMYEFISKQEYELWKLNKMGGEFN